MKVLTLIVHTNVQHALADLLRGMKQVPGFSFSQVEGHGRDSESDTFLSARDDAIGYIPRVWTDILLEDADVDAVLTTLCEQEPRLSGQGVYWVTTAEKGGHL